MIRFTFFYLFLLVPGYVYAQTEYKIGLTYSQPKQVKSPGLALGISENNHNFLFSISLYHHSPIPNQTMNSIPIESNGLYHYGFTYLRSAGFGSFAIEIGAGINIMTGPRYYKIDYYEAGKYHIYRVDNKRLPVMTLNFNLSYKNFYLLSEYNIEIRSLRLGIGLQLNQTKP